MAITCCRHCEPPKRTTTCHYDGTCQEYIEQKAKHDAELEEQNRQKFLDYSLYHQRGDAVRKAKKRN